MKYVLDTNVISEAINKQPNPQVMNWLRGMDAQELYLSVVTIGEIKKGVEKLPESNRKETIKGWFEHELLIKFDGQILGLDLPVILSGNRDRTLVDWAKERNIILPMSNRSIWKGFAILATTLCGSCSTKQLAQVVNPPPSTVEITSPQIKKVVANAIDQTNITHSYDPAYVKLAYPGGDVPMTTGVCTDVTIRAFRAVNIDFQKEVHEDMQRNFGAYPHNWGLKAPDSNIDHRRVPNLMTWLQRKGKALPITRNDRDYQPGDIVTWDFGGGQQHIGVVSNIRASSERFAIVHNVGSGTKVEDVLFRWQQIGHYRYFR